MSLAELRLANLRCLAAAELTLHPRLNLILGANGAGKTTLLEAVYLLGRGRSFRTRHTEQLIQRGAEGFWVAGRVTAPSPSMAAENVLPGAGPWGDGPSVDAFCSGVPSGEVPSGAVPRGGQPSQSSAAIHRLDLQCHRHEASLVRIDGRPVGSLAELSEVLPVQVIDPGIHRLIEEGPARRRRWLDWAVFHVEPGFIGQWQGYMRALRQRNAALRSAGEGDPAPWEGELARLGEGLTVARAHVLDTLQPYWGQALTALDAVSATLAFSPGWPRDVPLAAQLARQRERDRQRTHTGLGPHRCDVVLQIGGRPAREVISRGQQKILGAAMTLALAHYVASIAGRVPTLLLDDPAAELDVMHARLLLQAATGLGGQCIVTALEPESLAAAVPDRAFHVEHGGAKQL